MQSAQIGYPLWRWDIAYLLAAATIALTLPYPVLIASEEVVTIDSRSGVTIGIIVTRPAGKASAAAILFVAGSA